MVSSAFDLFGGGGLIHVCVVRLSCLVKILPHFVHVLSTVVVFFCKTTCCSYVML